MEKGRNALLLVIRKRINYVSLIERVCHVFSVTEVLNGICNASKEEDRRRKGTRIISQFAILCNHIRFARLSLSLLREKRFLVDRFLVFVKFFICTSDTYPNSCTPRVLVNLNGY